MPDKIFTDGARAAKLIKQQSDEFAIIQNPSYVFPPFEVYPLAPKLTEPAKSLSAIVMDMDGTTTTTEEICIHSLEYMVRKITGRMSKEEWKGLDHDKDYPHIIGNSTTKHVEYLINTYSSFIKTEELAPAFIKAALWTLITGKDEGRKKDAADNLINLGCGDVLSEKKLAAYIPLSPSENEYSEFTVYCIKKYGRTIKFKNKADIVRGAIDIYYQRYHEILLGITQGNAKALAAELLEDKSKHLIEPLPGVGIFLALVKGLLGSEAPLIAEILIEQYYTKCGSRDTKFNLNAVKKKLLKLGTLFEKNPLKIGVVTSSIEYEAGIVLGEVFTVLKEEVRKWDISAARKRNIIKAFGSYKTFYDGVVTASDSSEIRLKPHRDLYSIALHKLSVSPADFDKVIGFEDSESGTISIRAAGIGRCMAVPFAQTAGHNLKAAAFQLAGGLPEIILKHNLFVK